MLSFQSLTMPKVLILIFFVIVILTWQFQIKQTIGTATIYLESNLITGRLQQSLFFNIGVLDKNTDQVLYSMAFCFFKRHWLSSTNGGPLTLAMTALKGSGACLWTI